MIRKFNGTLPTLILITAVIFLTNFITAFLSRSSNILTGAQGIDYTLVSTITSIAGAITAIIGVISIWYR